MPELLYRPKVLISHSAKEPEARALCKAVADYLRDQRFEILWDENLTTSQAWRAVIDEWIWRCDGAVLVLSETATHSDYVAYEATLLRQRWKYAGSRFGFVPIWCPHVTEQVLIDRMGPIQLSEIQSLKIQAWPANATTDSAAFQDLAANVAKSLQRLRECLQSRHEIEDVLIKELDLGTSTDEALKEIAVAYGIQVIPEGAKKDRAAVLARRLLDFDVPIGEQRFRLLGGGIETMLAALSDGHNRIQRIINLVAPFCWVAPVVAIKLTSLAVRPSGQPRVVAWRRSWPLSERMYLYRAYCTRSKMKLRIVNVSDLSGGESQAILEHITACLADKVCYYKGASVEKVTKRIQKHASDGEPVFLILSADVFDASIVTEVCNKWKELCVFLYTEKMNEQQLAAQFPGIQLIEPPLSADDEDDARAGWGACMAAAGWEDWQGGNPGEFDS